MQSSATQNINTQKVALQNIAKQLKDYNTKNESTQIAQKIRELTSIVIWAEKNSLEVFNEFIDSEVLDKMFNIFIKSKQKELLILIIESISLMMANFQKQEGIMRVLFDPAMFNFLIIKFNGMTTEVAQYYINLLKSLTTRVDQNVLPLIYNEKRPSFALAWQASRFYNHPELLIRAASRTILLSLMKINKPVVRRYFSSFPFVIYYSHLALFIKQYWYKINELMEWGSDKEDMMRLPEIIQNHYDILLYVEDLMDNGDKNINKCIVNSICAYLISDTIYCLKSSKREQFSVNFCIYMLGTIYKALRNPLLIQILTVIVFGHYSLVKLTSKIQDSRFSYLDSYNKRWNFKTIWDPFDDELSVYQKLIFSQKRQPQANQKKREKVSNIGIVSQTLYLFGIVTNPKFDSQVDKLAKIYGFDMLSENRVIKYDSVVQIYECLRNKLFDANVDPNEFDENLLKDILFQFLSTKDGDLIMLVLQLFLNLFNNPGVSKQILSFCRLNFHQRSEQFHTRVSSQKLLTSCFQILTIYHVVRLCTIYSTIKLILFITNCYQSKKDIINNQMMDNLYKSLKISVDILNIKIDNYKNAYTLISLYEQALDTVTITKNKEFGIGAYGLVGQYQITSLYEKVTFTEKEELQKSIHYHLMLRQFIIHLFPMDIYFAFPLIKTLNSNPKPESPIVSFSEENSISCKLIEQNQALECFIIIEPHHMIILHPVTSFEPPTGTIYYQYIHRKLDYRNQDSKKLNILVVNSSCIIQKTITLLFESSKKCTEAKEKLQQRKEETTKEALAIIREDLQLCIQKMNFLKDKGVKGFNIAESI